MTSLGLGGCLADDMGLGKTITLIALHLHRQSDTATAGPHPGGLPRLAAGQLAARDRAVRARHPGAPLPRRRRAAWTASPTASSCSPPTARCGSTPSDWPRRPWGMVVADEAQHVKNPYSRHRPAAAHHRRARARRAHRHPGGEQPVRAVGDPRLDHARTARHARHVPYALRARPSRADSDPAAAERLAALVGPFLLRRRKSDPGIAPELPPKTETDRAVSLTTEQAGLYEAVVRETMAEIAGGRRHGAARPGREAADRA